MASLLTDTVLTRVGAHQNNSASWEGHATHGDMGSPGSHWPLTLNPKSTPW